MLKGPVRSIAGGPFFVCYPPGYYPLGSSSMAAASARAGTI